MTDPNLFTPYLQLADAVIITDSNHIVIDVNHKYELITGYDKHFVTGKKAGFVKSHLTPEKTYCNMKRNLANGKPWSGIFINRKKSGELWHSSITITPISRGDEFFYIGIFRELEQLDTGTYVPQIQMEKTKKSILEVLAISCEIQDPGIEEHLIRVRHLTKKLIYVYNERKQLHLHDDYMKNVTYSSILHDIGKSGIPEGILYKPGPLTSYERLIIETHPLIGFDILKKITSKIKDNFLEESYKVAENIILYHHEKWNGTGYPNKLKQEEIPLEARIVSVVDVFDALTSRRSYKEGWAIEKALEFLERQKNEHFDPEIVDAFLSIEEFKSQKDFA